MNAKIEGDPAAGPAASGSEAGATGPRRSRGVRALVALAACGVAMFWAGRVWYDQGHPLEAAARGLTAGAAPRRAEAVRVVADMGFRGPGRSIRLLIPALADREASVRGAAAESLGLLATNAIGVGVDADDVRAAAEALLGLTGDVDARVRAAVATSLAVIGSAAVSPRPAGRNGPAAETGAAPVVDVEAIVAALTAALDSPDEPVRQAGLIGLGATAAGRPGGPPPGLIKALDGGAAATRSTAAGALGHYRQGLDPAIPPLIRHLEDEQPQVREACAEAVQRLGPPAVSPAVAPAVIAALRAPDRAARSSLVALLSRLKPDPGAAVPALIVVLREPIESDQKAAGRGAGPYETYEGPAHGAAHALGAIAAGTPQAGAAMAALAEVVRSGPSQRKDSAAEALGAFGPAAAEAVPALVALLKETATAKAPTRAGGLAAASLGKIAPGTPAADEALAALIEAIHAPWVPTRQAAVAALPAFGPSAAPAVPAIREVQDKDPDPAVRKAAGAALGKIKT